MYRSITLMCFLLYTMLSFCFGRQCSECDTLSIQINKKDLTNLSDEETYAYQQCMFGQSPQNSCVRGHMTDPNENATDACSGAVNHIVHDKLNISYPKDDTLDNNLCATIVAAIPLPGKKNRAGIRRFCIPESTNVNFLCKVISLNENVQEILICDVCDTDNCNNENLGSAKDIEQYIAKRDGKYQYAVDATFSKGQNTKKKIDRSSGAGPAGSGTCSNLCSLAIILSLNVIFIANTYFFM